jgi:ribosome-interacting GTPase 1
MWWVGGCAQVIATAKSSDLVLMVLDAGKEDEKNHR